MELIMKKEKHSGDKISEQTLHEILLDIKYRLNHMEDMEADNRALIVKLVKKNNSIFKFLSKIDIEPVDSPFEDIELPPLKEDNKSNLKRMKHIKELLDEFMEKTKEMKEFEEELNKYKDKITPGQIGES